MVPVNPTSVSVTGVPAHIGFGDTLAVPATGGTVLTIVTVLCVVQQPSGPPVTTQVYVVVVVGEAMGFAMLALFRLAAGVQV